MVPNAHTLHQPTAAYMAELMRRIGKPQTWVAERTGISRRRIQYLLVGQKTFAGETKPVLLTYPEQFILETLAEVGDVFNKT